MSFHGRFSEQDSAFMRRAIELAKGGEGRTNPNPLVGAVIVREGRIIGEGFHHVYGGLHAEREALKDCFERGENPEGATIYVTLEPCCHFGKQAPCTQALIEAKISKVVIGSRDPNPLVNGKGSSFLRENGVIVEEDFLREECDSLNHIFFHYITQKTPFVALKYAMTADGKIATKIGKSKWISNEKSREFAHTLRNRYAGIMVGIGTVLADDPILSCRLKNEKGEGTGKNPVRVICDSNLSIPADSKIVRTAGDIPTIIACLEKKRSHEEKNVFSEKKDLLEKAGVEIIEAPAEKRPEGENPRPDLTELMRILGEKKIDSLLIEGGAEIHYSALRSGIVKKIYAFIAPKIFGGAGKSPVAGTGVEFPEEAFAFKLEKITRFDDDILLEYGK